MNNLHFNFTIDQKIGEYEETIWCWNLCLSHTFIPLINFYQSFKVYVNLEDHIRDIFFQYFAITF